MKMKQKTREKWLVLIFVLATFLLWLSSEVGETIIVWSSLAIMWLVIATLIFIDVSERRKLDREQREKQAE